MLTGNETFNEIKSRGVGCTTDPFACSNDYYGRALHSVWLPFTGKKLVPILQSAKARGLDTTLLEVPLPRPRTTVARHRLSATAYSRFAIQSMDHAERRYVPNALIYGSVEFQCGESWPYFDSRIEENSQSVWTIRLLQISRCASSDPDEMAQAIGASVARVAMEHFSSLLDAMFASIDADYLPFVRLNIRAQLPSMDDPWLLQVGEQTVVAIREEFEHGNAQATQYFALDENNPPRVIADDASFSHALDIFRFGRKAFDKPPRQRPAPNATHHFLLRTDPVLRYKNQKIINLSALAWMQAKREVSVDESERDYVDWESIAERRDVYEERLDGMKEHPSGQALLWMFLVDANTDVFVCKPLPASEMDVDAVMEFVDAAWAGKLGLLRGPPATLVIPSAYTDKATRPVLGDRLRARNVALDAPTSGFDAPIHVVKLWCQNTHDIRAPRERTPGRRDTTVATASMDFLLRWTQAVLLASHARSFYAGSNREGIGYNLVEYYGSGSQATAQYASHVGISNVEDFLDRWKDACLGRNDVR